MRSNEERIAIVKYRASQIKRQRQRRKNNIMIGTSITLSLIFIINLSVWIHGVMDRISFCETIEFANTASIFGNGAFLGYVVIGVIAFVLGVCVTLLCVRLRRFELEEKEKQDD